MATQFPGKGLPMVLWNGAAGNEPSYTAGTGAAELTIAQGEYSIWYPLNAGMQTDINIRFDGTPTTDVTIEYSTLPNDDDIMILDTVPGGDPVAVWTTNSRLSGFVRISNTSDADIRNAFLQQTVAYYG